ncbi:MarR family transcriptional regulator [Vibrio sp. TH_r3]|uniref:MarR family winged helix-turn-helix transcriptional regulator n=1 Tax=unclassified Vibrio TaxID=2614977 RepID=UPI0029549409|nr:MarR family transcriptional regulator [Vibrio sp. TH_r3]MDV7103371.1 MarR family transcriptional regulator [Vibrio sp. TH_r3]
MSTSTYRQIHHALREIHMKTRCKMVAEVTRQKVEFSPIEHKAMSSILRLGAVSQQVLAQSMNRDKAQIARIIARLLKQDLITKQENPEDKRSVLLALTEKGLTLLKRLDEVEAAFIHDMLIDFNQQESEMLRSLLQRVNNNLK